MFVARRDGDIIEAMRRTPDGTLINMRGEVGSVESSRESFHITGTPTFPGTHPPWEASCDRDQEATDAMLRGRVRSVTLAWEDQCRERIAANMERYDMPPRQREVVWSMFAGWTQASIAEELELPEATISKFQNRIALRLGIPAGRGWECRTAIIVRLLDLDGLVDIG